MPTENYAYNVSKSGLRIQDQINPTDEELWIPTEKLESILKNKLLGMQFTGLPLRTRSKVIKSEICKALGYPVPQIFTRTKPRFWGQQFDVYIQKSNNLQIWNEKIDTKRRYVIIKLSSEDKITGLRVLTGLELAKLDNTGTLTQKYQARLVLTDKKSELMIGNDTENLKKLISETSIDLRSFSPNEIPKKGQLLPITNIYSYLGKLVGISFPDAGIDQERNRGARLHQLVCEALGFRNYHDDGIFPDITHQLLEIKLQTSLTIDLGLVKPSSNDPLPLPKIDEIVIKHSDVRYAIFYAEIYGDYVIIKNFYLTTGEAFFSRFPQFKGKIVNKKLQITISDKLFE